MPTSFILRKSREQEIWYGPTKFSIPKIREQYFQTFWYFINERQKVYYSRLAGLEQPWTDDPILQQYKFTNVFRAADRVSQYLINHVIYKGSQEPEEVAFRTLLFKIFNLEETWELFLQVFGTPTLEDFTVERYGNMLDKKRHGLWNNAYMMTGSKAHGYDIKHWNYLTTLYNLMHKQHFGKHLPEYTGLDEIYATLVAQPLFSGFLAYQFAIDLNYSNVIDFDESEWVHPGPGAIRGIMRCFELSEKEAQEQGAYIIYWLVDTQEQWLDRYGYKYRDCSLFSRRLQAIDLQNVFCETDKYCRAAFPEGDNLGKARIKQKYNPSPRPADLPNFPAKWNINGVVDWFYENYWKPS